MLLVHRGDKGRVHPAKLNEVVVITLPLWHDTPGRTYERQDANQSD